MKTLSISVLFCLLFALPAQAIKVVKAKQKVKFVMKGDKGTNGAGVAWNPKAKVYYACFAGNVSYPLMMFSKKGKLINETLKTLADVRGFWFNSSQNRIEGNAYLDENTSPGYFYRNVDSKGVPGADTYVKFPELDAPTEQSVAAYDFNNDELVYRDREYVTRFSKKDGMKKGGLTLSLPEGVSWDDISEYSIIYTGKKGEEYGVLDYSRGKVYLFDSSTGLATKSVTLPEEAPDPKMFNFSYANNMFWVFSTLSRTWYGYSHG